MRPVVRLRLTGDAAARHRLAVRLRRRVGFTVVETADLVLVDLPLDRIERTGPSIEARALEAGLELWLDELDARVAAADLDGYGSRIWPALGDAHVRNELAAERGDPDRVDPFAFVRVVERDGGRFVENARASWDPPMAAGPAHGPSHWSELPTQGEIEAAVGPDLGIVFIELHPDRAATIARPADRHDDPELEAMLPSPAPGEWWEHVESVRDPRWPRLRRGLRELGVDRRTTTEAFALHGTGHDVVDTTLHRVPGTHAPDLERVFSTTVLGFKSAPWIRERVADHDVLVARQRIDGDEHFGVMTATEGVVATLGGPRLAVERMLVELRRSWDEPPAD